MKKITKRLFLWLMLNSIKSYIKIEETIEEVNEEKYNSTINMNSYVSYLSESDAFTDLQLCSTLL